MRVVKAAAVGMLAVAMIWMGTGPASAASNGLAPANGEAYKRLSAKWWQWAASTSFSDSGPFGEQGTDCSQNQPVGNTWFLAGQFTGNPAERSCDVPVGVRLFVPIANVECSTLEAAPFFGATVAERRDCAESFRFEGVIAELDGEPITNDLNAYRYTSPDFPIRAVAGNPAAIPEGRGLSVSAGIWLLLDPLTPGVHTVHFKGSFPDFGFAPEATYHLHVS